MKTETHSFILWSGGKDSTYLVWDRLKRGGSVTAAYVTVLNNETKTQAELDATDKMAKFFMKTFPGKFTFEKIAKVELERGGGEMILKQPALWLLPAAYAMSGNRFNEVCIGYVLNDDAISYLDDFKRIWRSLSRLSANGFPPLTFPLFRDLCVFCEVPVLKSGGCEPCGYCDKCKDRGVGMASALKWDEPQPYQEELYFEI